ncbi:Cd(II)/Pb(II)-responsive transcriptional regulator [Massilia sp. YMA4]|uniref:Cd(II)/Pb(II)-responsive transcriptional regulator n=1 Tax=[Empedobacter] haloabium TaxID=592317 RepID=A0ABZ1UTG4_9BURK|nr:Cd(II)/Pb(II)-responsive transcriptional regulator [Massilia sp. YMA4]AXA91325.1 Cd(II)/Pb(II)-responsive transcriptional regulator [Massilia sp. YMA4]
MYLKIGELAARAGCLPETIRFYEQQGLLPAPGRSAGNYRLYDRSHEARLTFIRRCRSLGMSLGEVKSLLLFQDNPDQPCLGVDALVDQHMSQIQQQMAELLALQEELARLRASCRHGASVRECEILRGLATLPPAP